MSICKFNRFLAEVGQSRSYKELNENLLSSFGAEREKGLQRTNTYLDAIYSGRPDYLKSLIEKGYGIGYYKDTAMKLAVKIIKAKRAKSDVVKIFIPLITRNLLVEPALNMYANNIIIHDKISISLEYFFNHSNCKLYIKIIPKRPRRTLPKCLYKK